jgi:hypothetical protein
MWPIQSLLLLTAAVGALACEDCYWSNDAMLQQETGPSHAARVPQCHNKAKSTPCLGPNQLPPYHGHPWLVGRALKEQNYGADWGDYVSFTKRMRQKADDLDVDLLLIDTGIG